MNAIKSLGNSGNVRDDVVIVGLSKLGVVDSENNVPTIGIHGPYHSSAPTN